MSRMKRLSREELTSEQAELYEQMVGGPRSSGPQAFSLLDAEGGLRGPFGAMLLSPPVGTALQSVGVALRYESDLSPRLRELATLAVAARHDSEFETYAHEAIAKSIGMGADEIEAVQRGEWSGLVDASERVGVRLVLALLDGDVADALFEEARDALGERRIFELSTLVGYYATLALQLRLFRVGV